MAATLQPSSSLKRACHFLLGGGVLGFVAVLCMLALPGRRELVLPRRQGPCHPSEDPSSQLPLCPKARVSSRKADELPEIPPFDRSAVAETLEERQRRIEKEQLLVEARDEADRKARQQRAAERAEAERRAREHEAEEKAEAKAEAKERAEAQSAKSSKEEEEESAAGKDTPHREAEAQEEPAARPKAAEREAEHRSDEDAGASEVKENSADEPKTPCHTAVKGEKCFEHVVWSMHEGFHEHPQWYPGLSAKSTFAEFQYVLNLTGTKSQHCPIPCIDKREHPTTSGCRTASPGEHCYKEALWAKTHGIYEHPEWYGRLTNKSSFEEFQAHLRSKQQADCPEPCPPSLQPVDH